MFQSCGTLVSLDAKLEHSKRHKVQPNYLWHAPNGQLLTIGECKAQYVVLVVEDEAMPRS